MDEMKLLTVREVCEATRLSKSMIYKLLDQGILHRVRLPGCVKVLIAEAELKRFVSEGIQAGAEISQASLPLRHLQRTYGNRLALRCGTSRPPSTSLRQSEA